MMMLIQPPFYRHDSLGPGAPLREITGLSEQAGFYDWAGRRLFHADGEPDTMCPGAYRYQHNPDCCDLEAADSDPRSPRYEPMHLRHKPGDTWIIDVNRPHDPYDPGPYGSHGWYQDRRTGRHRRDELPDPLPAEGWVPPEGAWFPGTSDWPEPAAPQSDRTERISWHGGSGSEDGSRHRNDDRPPPRGGVGLARPSPEDDRPSPEPRGSRQRSPWGRRDAEAPRPEGNRDRGCRRAPEDRGEEHDRTGSARTVASRDEHRFSKMREEAFDRFMVESAALRAAHFQPESPYLRERAVWALRWFLWVLACGLAPMPGPLTVRSSRPEPQSPQRIPTQPGPTTLTRNGLPDRTHSPGTAIAAAFDGARAARAVISARSTQSSGELADAVRSSAVDNGPTHWRTRPNRSRPGQNRRRQTARPGSYMAAWEQAFDTDGACVFGGAA
ncbi:hypothetical protein [Glycomyces sp. NRRL B-16210]|uniref:hypothetical protein n=1 Tax=Glycomyces sp. NRRL B-16210 TaxID=1463821 RepID=UPI00105E0CD4|nr:hypothetical protein [Glycomyces sp. NRRL B-16210]